MDGHCGTGNKLPVVGAVSWPRYGGRCIERKSVGSINKINIHYQ